MVKVQQRGLGKGLSALMGDAPAPVDVPLAANSAVSKTMRVNEQQDAPAGPVEGLLHVPLSSLVANRYQPRQHFDEVKLEELSRSIKSNGVMQPIVVRSSSEFAGKFEIIAGERRFRASEMAGLKEVPILLRDMTDLQALELAIVENIQRHDLNPLEEAQGYQRLMEEFSYTQEKLAKSVGKSRSHIANLLRLLALPEAVKHYIASGELSMGHARALIGAPEPEQLAMQVIEQELSVRQTEQLVKDGKGGNPQADNDSAHQPNGVRPQTSQPRAASGNGRAGAAAPKDADILALENMLTENLGLKVEINDEGDQQGQIVIHYGSLAQLDGVLQKLDNS